MTAVPPEDPVPAEPDHLRHDPELVKFLVKHYPHNVVPEPGYHAMLTRMCMHPDLVSSYWAHCHHDTLETYLLCFERLTPKVPANYRWWFENWTGCYQSQENKLSNIFLRTDLPADLTISGGHGRVRYGTAGGQMASQEDEWPPAVWHDPTFDDHEYSPPRTVRDAYKEGRVFSRHCSMLDDPERLENMAATALQLASSAACIDDLWNFDAHKLASSPLIIRQT